MEEYGHPGHNIVTLFDRTMTRMECRCRFWEKEGFPCRHMFFVMKHEHLKDIPNRLILKRWRRDAKAIEEYGDKSDDMLSERSFLLRHGALHAASQWMLYLGSKNRTVFKTAMEGIRRICTDIHAILGQPNEGRKANANEDIRDPVVVRTKGAPRSKGKKGKKRRCTFCKRTGHTKRTCVDRVRNRSKWGLQEDEESVEIPGANENFIIKIRGTQERIVGTAQSEILASVADAGSCDYHQQVLDLLKSLNATIGSDGIEKSQ
ncbi:protein FAR-RED ELONGATED HYPOCOTYL 3-like [Arachis stenosperma]|uniref:protein FAR-RED ELONGATED HYPOCOTYL 3-like n=1 Tax=Arachis stenosperma TaxID=217475 RepID=UPI0025ACB8E2|nr:protein FAR-RED ELONGATED HYPOCOTYL 3-like [Arachis stenosperma]